METKPTSFRLDRALLAQLRLEAHRDRRTLTGLVEKILWEWIEMRREEAKRAAK